MDQDARPFHVAEEFVPQAGTGMGSLDQTGDIGHYERAVQVDLDAAQVRMFGGERIIRNLRSSFRQSTEQRALARVGLADQPDIGNDFQFEDQLTPLALFARRGFAWGSIGG